MSRVPTMVHRRPAAAAGLSALALLVAVRLEAVTARLDAVTAQDPASGKCAAEKVVLEACDPDDEAACAANCLLHGSDDPDLEPYLKGKCCKHAGVNANLLAFEDSAAWIPRLEEFGKCTGANIRLQYVDGGEDGMADALILDVGENNDETTGEGIYDAYIARASWLPPVREGLRSLSEYIKENNDYIKFNDINPASRSAVSFDGKVRALPLDADYIAMGWRQDVFENPDIQNNYHAVWGEELKVPDTLMEMVSISERLNGKYDYNNDGEMDWGFCLTPQTNYFQAFLAPILQTHVNECEEAEGGFKCTGADTGQNIFFDVDNFEPLIYNEGYRYAVELYTRFVQASNCQTQTKEGVKCDRKTAFPTGRCAGVISMSGTMTNLLREGGKYAPNPDVRMDSVLAPGQYWGRRKVFPGSIKVINWNKKGRPLENCTEVLCPLAKNGINYAPFFSEGGESYALNGRHSKPAATDAMWDMITWLSTLPVGEVPLAGIYRKSQLTPEALDRLEKQGNSTIMVEDLKDILDEYFKSEEEGGNTVQDLFIPGFSQYNEALNTELHKNLILQDISEGGLFNMRDPSKSINPKNNKREFDERYDRFINALAERYDDVHAQQDGGTLDQLVLWRGALDISPAKSKEEICQDLLAASDHANFEKLDCLNVVVLKDLCQPQESDVEEYKPGTCEKDNNNATVIIAVVLGIICAGMMAGVIYLYKSKEKAKKERIEAMNNIDTEICDIDKVVEEAWRRRKSLIMKRAALKIPSTWTESSDTLVSVPPEDEEYWAVIEKIRITIPNAHISKLWRVQNSSLWSYYLFHKDRFEKNDIVANERRVWHGTSALNPAVVYGDQMDGFMMQYAAKGLWGRGIYFADKASYSKDYSHSPYKSQPKDRPSAVEGELEMFQARLLVGNEVKLSEDRWLTVPPKDPISGLKCNTVTGHTNGSQVWIVYENGRAYPEYLVRYYIGSRDTSRTPYESKEEARESSKRRKGDFGLNELTPKSQPSGARQGLWEYLSETGWAPYDAFDQARIEKTFQDLSMDKSLPGIVAIKGTDWEYEVNVKTMVQTNTQHFNQKKRKIRFQTT